jgi:hypothetical protein
VPVRRACLVLLSLWMAACAPLRGGAIVANVKGRRILVPPPRAMRWCGPGIGPVLHVWRADSVRARHRRFDASLMEVGGRNEAETRSVLVILGHDPRHSFMRDSAGRARWESALRAADRGERAPLPPAPDSDIVVTHLAVPGGFGRIRACRGRNGRLMLYGETMSLIAHRGVWLSILVDEPGDCLDLSRLRAALVDWTGSVQAANPD